MELLYGILSASLSSSRTQCHPQHFRLKAH